MRVAIVGAAGQLGAAVVREFDEAHDVLAFDRAALDLTRPEIVRDVLVGARPHVIVNCAAYNAVDAAEDHAVEAIDVNAIAVRSLARIATSLDATLVHYSTDFVFDGRSETPYSEADRPNPQSVYAASKLIGEWFAADAPRAFVLRVESLFGAVPGGRPAKGSLATIVSALRSGAAARVFEDRVVSPTYVVDAARATRRLVETSAAPGLYHCVNDGFATWAEVAEEAARLLGVPAHLERVKVADVSLRASRPKYCALSNQKLRSAGVAMPSWQDALGRYLRGLADEPAHQIANRQA